MILGGVFERFPRLRFVLTEQGCSWIPSVLHQLDGFHAEMVRTGRVGELKYEPKDILPAKPSEYFARCCWVGVSFPSPGEAAARHQIGLDKFMWGSDYPHYEGTFGHTQKTLHELFDDVAPDARRRMTVGAFQELFPHVPPPPA